MKRCALTVLAAGFLATAAFGSIGQAAEPMMDDPILLNMAGATGSDALMSSNGPNVSMDTAGTGKRRNQSKTKRKRIRRR